MKAIVRHRYGGPDVVELAEVDIPEPADQEILVRVHAASVNRADLDALAPRPGFLRLFMGVRAPRWQRVGCDAAGVVERVGPGVTRFRPGDRVFADLYVVNDQGAFAEYVAAPERVFQEIPEALSFEDAATLPHAGTLAVQGLRRRDGRTPGPGDRVLIGGASGNVGPFAVQLAKLAGAEVTGVCRTEKMDFVRSLGADHVIDYTTTDYTATGARYDWILDTDSHHGIRDVRRALRPNGAYVTLGGDTGAILQALVLGPLSSIGSNRRAGLMLWWKPFNPPDVLRLAGLVASGTVRPAINRRFPLAEAREALRWVNEGHARGKVVISVV